jgi:hypothetical protein
MYFSVTDGFSLWEFKNGLWSVMTEIHSQIELFYANL